MDPKKSVKKSVKKSARKIRKEPYIPMLTCGDCDQQYQYRKVHNRSCTKKNCKDVQHDSEEDLLDSFKIFDIKGDSDFEMPISNEQDNQPYEIDPSGLDPEIYNQDRISPLSGGNEIDVNMDVFDNDEPVEPFDEPVEPVEPIESIKKSDNVDCRYCGRSVFKGNIPRHKRVHCKKNPYKGGKSKKNKRKTMKRKTKKRKTMKSKTMKRKIKK